MENDVKAILSIYSAKPDAFDSTEVGSLQELANNLSEALARMQSADSEGHGLVIDDPIMRQLREIIDASSRALFLLDRGGRVRLCNQRAREMLGQGGEGVIGRPFSGVLFQENASLQDAIGTSLMSKSPQTLTIHTEVPQPRRYVVELQPSAEGLGVFFDDVGQGMSHGSDPSDKNQRQLVEERLWETGGKLRAIIQTSPLAILSLDPDGSVSTWNPAAERIFDWEEVGSARPFSFLPEGSGEMEELKARILKGERLVDIEVVRKYPGGQERTVSISTAPILDQAGQVGGIIVVGSDTSERKRMEDRLIQLNEALRLVNGILRHDTLNELMVVNGSLDMYQKTKQEKFLETGRKAVSRSVEMIKRMKELESMAVSGGSLHEYDLHQVIEDILKGYMVEFQITGEARLFADNALPSAIDNIVRNAMIHGKADRIEAKIWQEGGFTYLSIADDGIGIPDSIKQRIFVEGFSYGNNAGSGLGLYLVSKTLERYGGKVRVEDNRPRGTTFVLSFPKNLAEMSAS
jgi:PAS domain S-box-containing protein